MSSRGRLFTRLPPLVRVPDLSDAMRLAWLEMLEGRPCAVRILRTLLVIIAAIFARVDL